MAIPLGRPLPDASRDLPGRQRGNAPSAVPIWPCSRWGLPCRFRHRKRGALLPHRFILAWPLGLGGLFSVALSLESPPPDVIRHRVSVEPGLSSRRNGRPSGHLTHTECRRAKARSQYRGAAPQGPICTPRRQFRRASPDGNGAGRPRSPVHSRRPYRV